MTHLAYVCEDNGIPIDGLKGSSIHARSMVAAFTSLGIRVSLFSPRIGGTDWAAGLGIAFHEIMRSESTESDSFSNLQSALERVHSRDPLDAVYERLSLMAPSASQWCRRNAVPHWVEVNAPLVREAGTHRGLDNQAEAEQIEREVLFGADLILPVSPWLLRWIAGLGIPLDRIHVMPNGVDASWLSGSLTATMGSPYELLFVGSLRPWHDLPTLIRAMEHLPELFRLTVVGDGPMRSAWQQKSAHLGERIMWRGALRLERIPVEIDAAGICIAPYAGKNDFYFCPIKILEYGAREKPVIAPDLPDLREQFPPDSLIYYHPDDPIDLARKVQSLAADCRTGRSAAKLLRRHAESHTWTNHAAQIINRGFAVRHPQKARSAG